MSDYRKTYSFKSVGQTQESYGSQVSAIVPVLPIGIKTPIRFSNPGGNLFDMTTSLIEQVKDNLKNLVLTNSGERLMLTDFGANLRPLGFELSKEDVANEAIRRISKTVQKYMPYVELETFEAKVLPTNNGLTVGNVIRIGYSIPSIGASSQNIEVVIYTVG